MLYNIKKYINHINGITMSINDFPITFLAAQMRSVTLAGSLVFFITKENYPLLILKGTS